MHIDFDRFDKLVIETGKTKSYLCRAIEKSRYYLRDAKKTDADIPEETVKRLADELNTTVDYLQGYTDVKEKPTAGAAGMSAAEAGRYAIEHAGSEDELWQLISRAQERIREMNGKK